MKTSAPGIELIKKHEGVRLQAYLCPANVWTIGYGHTATAKSGMRITQEQALQLLRLDLAKMESSVKRRVKVPLSQNQFDALVSWVFNLGEGALAGSTLLKRINGGTSLSDIGTSWRQWNKARVKGVLTVLPGLVKRRQDEFNLYSKQ